jgi:hypothetical protein
MKEWVRCVNVININYALSQFMIESTVEPCYSGHFGSLESRPDKRNVWINEASG